MNASSIINDSMSLDEKLKAIDEAMKNVVPARKDKVNLRVDEDPSNLLMCEGCQ